jgi:gas vesicle protein
MAAALKAARSAMGHVSEGLEKVRAKPWAQPLGKALEVSGKIVGGVGDFVPGAGIIGGALSFGATLLNPEPSLKDLQKDLKDIKKSIEEGAQGKAIIKALQKEQKDIEAKIANPAGEIRADFDEVKGEMKEMLKKVGEFSECIADDMSRMKDKISQTFHVVTDQRYKVSS